MNRFTLLMICFSSVLACQPVSAAPEPILHWNFDAPQGTAVLDVSGNDRHGEIGKLHHQHPMPTWHPTKGVRKGAVRVESRSKIEARKIHPLGEAWALSFWCLQEDPDANGNQFVRLPGIWVQCVGEKLIVNINGLGRLSATRVTPGHWEHVVLSIRPGAAALHVNGFPAAQVEKEGWVYTTEGGRLFFGAPDWHRQYRGLIDETKLFLGQVTDDRVVALALDCYHPEADWIKACRGPVLKLVQRLKLRRDEVEELKRLGAPDAAALLKAMADGPPDDRAKAAVALGALQAPEAFQLLLDMLKHPAPQFATAACEALALMGDAKAVPELKVLLEKLLPEVRKASAEALATLGEPGQQALVRGLRTRRLDIAKDVSLQLRKRGYKPQSDADGVRYWIAVNDWRRAGEIGEAGAPALVDALGAYSVRIKYLNMRAVQHVGHPEAVVPEIQETVVPDGNVANRAEQLLLKLGAAALPSLQTGLEGQDVKVRIRCAGILEQIGDRAATMDLAAALKDDDSRVVVAVAEALAALKDARAARALIEALANPDVFARQAAADALGSIGAAAGDAMIQALGQSRGTARVELVRALGLSAAAGAASQLQEELASDDWQVRARAAEALGRIDDKAAVPRLIGRLNSDNEWTVRLMAAKGLGVLRTPPAMAALKVAANEDREPLVRRQAALSLKQKPEAGEETEKEPKK